MSAGHLHDLIILGPAYIIGIMEVYNLINLVERNKRYFVAYIIGAIDVYYLINWMKRNKRCLASQPDLMQSLGC